MSQINKAVLKLAQENPEFRTALVAELKTARGPGLRDYLSKAFQDGRKMGYAGKGHTTESDWDHEMKRVLSLINDLRNLKIWSSPLGPPTGTWRKLEDALHTAAHEAGVYAGNMDDAAGRKLYATDKQGSRPVFLNMNKLWKTLPKRGRVLRNAIELKNGTILSIQASEGAYSEPRKDKAAYYTEFEVMVNEGPSLPELRPFAEGGGNHGYVPVGVLNKILKRYGYAGLAYKSRSKRAKHDPAFFDEVLALLPGAKRGRANDPSAFTYKGLKFQLVPDKRPFRWRLTSREHLAAGSDQGNYGIGDPQSAPHLTAQYAKTFVKNVQSGRIQKKADKWETKPKGWTDASRKKFWESLTSAAPKHKVTECIKRMDKHMGGNAGAFCASLADRVMPGWRQEAAKDKKKKASLTQPLGLRRDYGAGSGQDEWLDVDEVREHCPPCADKMAANGIRKVKASTLRLAMQRR